MKKLLFLFPLILLTACDNNNIPKCWNDNSIENLKTITWNEGPINWHIKNINNTIEIPGMTESTNKYRYCRFDGTLTNGKKITGDYHVYKTIKKTGTGVYTSILTDTVSVSN